MKIEVEIEEIMVTGGAIVFTAMIIALACGTAYEHHISYKKSELTNQPPARLEINK